METTINYLTVSPSHKVEITTDITLMKSLNDFTFSHLGDDGHVYAVFNVEPKEGEVWKQYAYKVF